MGDVARYFCVAQFLPHHDTLMESALDNWFWSVLDNPKDAGNVFLIGHVALYGAQLVNGLRLPPELGQERLWCLEPNGVAHRDVADCLTSDLHAVPILCLVGPRARPAVAHPLVLIEILLGVIPNGTGAIKQCFSSNS